MAQSVDPDNFFQTSDSLAERERKAEKAKNDNGSPIRLPTKILAIVSDPEDENRIYVSGSDGTVRRIDLVSRSSISFTGPTSPLPCLAISTSSPDIIYAGSWSKHIYRWDTKTRKPGRTISNAHGDFIKALVCVTLSGNSLEDPASSSTVHGDKKPVILVSAGADRNIAIWDAKTDSRLLLLRGHNMGILALAIDPESLRQSKPRSGSGTQESTAVNPVTGLNLWSASSDREIRRWTVSITATADSSLQATELRNEVQDQPLTPLPSSVNQILFVPALAPDDDDNDHPYDVTSSLVAPTPTDLLAASASGATVLLSRARSWAKVRTFSHGEQNGVRTIAPSPDGTLLVAAGRDEDVWLWDTESEELLGRWRGHSDEITGVLFSRGSRVISGGLDGTVRTWRLKGGGGEGTGWVLGAEGDEGKGGDATLVTKLSVEDGIGNVKIEAAREFKLTAEEEAELAELMDSD